MKSPNGMALTAALASTDAPDIHLMFMVGVLVLAGVAGLGTVTLLLLLAPFAALMLPRPQAKKPQERTTEHGVVPLQLQSRDGCAVRLPPPHSRRDEAA
ncbi:hypothetical protein [Paenarthrobacter nicotinovorans]|uniref:hypothetical protein n=1 Tax=Paenarthrobacter nicotinovorans TaxID=29320 RepID=UPI00047AEDAB|nr:hypothetical protein [Paenarthrobacter nicotinovorans]